MQNPTRIEEYAEMLTDTYNNQVIDIYSIYIKIAASSSSQKKIIKKYVGL